MKCIIIDDEPLALGIVKSYCEDVGTLEIIGTFTNALEAIPLLNAGKVDLVFSDIEMPQINGIDFIKTLDHRPLFIFTTAYSQYALEGFEINAVDYLVKPIPFPRFVKAVNRAKEIYDLKNTSQTTETQNNEDIISSNTTSQFIFVKSEYDTVKIQLSDITYVQGLKDYLKIYTIDEKPILTLMTFKDIQSKLPPEYFIRVHRSYIINIRSIDTIQRSKIVIGDVRIPIGDSYKVEFTKRIGI
ncbi:LytTR family DNA-binding domain-containing protein [Aquimarina sp. 2201CG5-10]|uniref:LytR/AlgR family response regulator transcription factor n=1 Tax=Aquimarina callyspongiae TaxID=3098150 RepID=UPI002AB3A03C|nr:LytTR family DNA-binding domain-containing protein [Aquimarina sp. 2201CG5-10]MDY8136144.1 LytTR family DNA-binding domain-containing protein [Aquimarina sp. 2201CG5-10]